MSLNHDLCKKADNKPTEFKQQTEKGNDQRKREKELTKTKKPAEQYTHQFLKTVSRLTKSEIKLFSNTSHSP